jgi:hypothetical protein
LFIFFELADANKTGYSHFASRRIADNSACRGIHLSNHYIEGHFSRNEAKVLWWITLKMSKYLTECAREVLCKEENFPGAAK